MKFQSLHHSLVKSYIILRLLCIIFIIIIFQTSSVLAYENEIKQLSISLSKNINKSGKKNLAVVDFTDLQGNVTEFVRFLAEEFYVALASADRNYEVIDRTRLKVILQEHQLSSTGVNDPETAKKVGKITGVESLLTGTITPLGGNVRISVKILDTTTAKIIGESSNLTKNEEIDAPNLTVTAMLKFENVSSKGDKVSLRVECKAGDSYIFDERGHFNAVLRNIPLINDYVFD